ncbi:histidine phosphatase family protein [Ornithinimicrobium sp. F0845]|uniref:SixA phosphatase family protein n=1 Tax=Ornithinimicrobium sp. F0845 TaxID=2926412 RepID=UPI001FF44151|nr:histidine phosphatase family protein [Ornithinimicrobium sp. F0845]MCK0112409.1 histidine phosphatase family protein [Ornithinimicrobium sp. F0845]
MDTTDPTHGPARRLVLVRHAKTEQVPGKVDHDRELLPRGVADSRAGGAWLVEHDLVPDLVLCSTATRAQQTWERLAEGGDLEDVEVWDDRRIYNAYPDEILEVVWEASEEARTVMVVGHAPGIPSLAAGLADPEASDSAALDQLHEGMPTAVGVVLELDSLWAELGAESARLTGFHRWRGSEDDA